MSTASTGGFWPKIILWIIIVLASFMYIRSLAHKGAVTTKTSTAPVSSEVQAKSTSAAPSQLLATSGEQTLTAPESTVAKVGEVAIAPAKVEPVPADEPTGAADAGAAAGEATQSAAAEEQASTPAQTSVQETVSAAEVSASVGEEIAQESAAEQSGGEQEAVAEQAELVEEKPVVAGEAEKATAETVVTDAAKETVDASVSEKTAEGVAAQPAPMAEAPEAPTATAEAFVAAPTVETAVTESAEAAVAEQVATANSKSAASDKGASAKETDSVPAVVESGVPAAGKRPSFKELFGYERPRPRSGRPAPRWQEEAGQSTSEEMARIRRFEANPWRYAPRRPQWNQNYPGQYGMPYGAYPAPVSPYPQVPEWAAPYQPYEFGAGAY